MFKVTLERMGMKDGANKALETYEFETKREANTFKRKLAKENNCKKHGYHLVNYSNGLEIATNY